MKHALKVLMTLLILPLATLHAAAPELSRIASRADLDAVIAATNDAPLKQSLTDHAAAILAAAERHPHVVAVMRTMESAPGAYTRTNTTPEALGFILNYDIEYRLGRATVRDEDS